jgi:hypothetical protein
MDDDENGGVRSDSKAIMTTASNIRCVVLKMRYGKTVRTTLTIDDDVLAAAKALADAQHKTTGEVISALARQALQPPPQARRYRKGVPLLEVKSNATPVTMELVNQLRDELP